MFQELKISDSIWGLTFSILTCSDAVGNAAQNHSDSAWCVCQKEAAQIFFLKYSQLGDILCAHPKLIQKGFRKEVKETKENIIGN